MTDYQMVPIDSLKPSGYNPNVLTPDQYAALVAEISVQGRLLKPIVANEKPDQDGRHEIIDGEHNWRAAMEVGLTEVPVELIEADDFEARRQTLIRNRTGRNDNLKLGRVYADMIAARSLTYRDLAAELKISHGTVRNMLLYPMAWDLLSMHGQPLVDDAGHPVEPECYSFGMAAYTEAMVTKMAVRAVRALVARLQGLVDEGDEAQQAPDEAPAEEEHVRLALLHFGKATDEGRQRILERIGILEKIADALGQAREAYDKGYAEGVKHGRVQRDPEPIRVKRRAPEPEQPERARSDATDWLQATYAGEHTIARRILDFLRDQPDVVARASIVEACGAPPPSVQRALDQLKVAGFVRREGYGRYRITDAGRNASSSETEPVIQPAPAVNGVDNSYTERGSRIRAERNARGLTAKELAKLAGIAPNYVSMAELGRLTPSGGPAAGRPAFAKLEAALGLTAH